MSQMKQVWYKWRNNALILELAPDNWICLCLTEQIKPQHIISEDSLDDDEPRKGKPRPFLFT